MYTPRRILLIVLGMFGCLGGYFAYAQAFGRIDGLPQLPERFALVADPSSVMAPPVNRISPIEQKLEQAFGPGCLETDSRQYRQAFEVGSKGIVIAGNPVFKDGKVHISPLSVAIFGKNKGQGGQQEITTMHSDMGILTFDKPVDSLMSMSGRHIVRADILSDPEVKYSDPRKGRVVIRNNRRTPELRSLEVITVGPIHYVAGETDDKPSLVTTDALLEMYDWQNNETLGLVQNGLKLPTMLARGMRMQLKGEKASGKSGAPVAGKITGVDKIDLLSEVTMNLWADSQSNFLAGEGTPPPAPAPGAKPAELVKSLIQIETQGPFHYDFAKDLALFENAPSINPNLPNYVRATRKAKNEQLDILKCDNLEIQFKRIAEAPPATASFVQPPQGPKPLATTPPPEQTNRQVERVHASGLSIALSSDSEKLHASGNDLVYEAASRTTTLKGNPEDGIFAVKEGNVIQSRELFLMAMPKPEGKADPKNPPAPGGNGIREARARGPGTVGMGEFDPVTRKHVQQATWNDWLVFTRVVENGQHYQILKLNGQAGFKDTKGKQTLKGEEIRVWLSDEDGSAIAAAVPANPTEKEIAALKPKKAQPKPLRIEATHNVFMDSPEMILREADLLNIFFKEIPVNDPPRKPAVAVVATPTSSGAAGTANATATVPAKKEEEKKKEEPRPIEIRARRMDAWVLRKVSRFDQEKTVSELERAVCTGNVRVDQAPPADKKGQRGMLLLANELELIHHGENLHKLTLKAESAAAARDKPAELHLEEVSMLGEIIVVDQLDNHARVFGPGSMRLKSGTDLQGNKVAKDSNVYIHWRESMEFEGSQKWARFVGAVQADQEESGSRVLCPEMQVAFDREVIFKAESASGQPRQNARIDTVRCARGEVRNLEPGKPVVAIEEKRIKDKLVKYQRIEADELDYVNNLLPEGKSPSANTTGNTKSHGPGTVLMFQPGSDDPLDGTPSNQPKKEVMKLTWIEFSGQMQTFGRDRAMFLDPVTVLHGPADRPDEKLEKGVLKPGWIQMQARKSLTVSGVETLDDKRQPKTVHRMDAAGDVRVLGEDFDGRGEEVKYDELKNTLIFIGTRDNPASIEQFAGVGNRGKTQRAERILYNLKTKTFSVEGGLGTSFSGAK